MSDHPQAGLAFNQATLKAWVVGAGRLALWTTWGREPQRVSPAGQATRPRHPRLAEEIHTATKSRDWLKKDTPATKSHDQPKKALQYKQHAAAQTPSQQKI